MTDETKKPCECGSCLSETIEELTECADCTHDVCEDCLHECHECGKRICADCLCRCESCETALCGNCATECNVCNNTVCEQCLNQCTDCNRRICDNCTSACDACEQSLCRYCGRYCYECDNLICDECTYWCPCDRAFCSEDCRDECDSCGNTQEPCYHNPYTGTPALSRETFTVGLEIEIDGHHDRDHMTSSPLIAGWCPDGSLTEGGLEYQTQPLTMRDIDALTTLVEGIPEPDENRRAGGHMHISRTDRQTPSRWYWALKALTDDQCDQLNMRHHADSRWCQLTHNQYGGKYTAVNADHRRTLELRTFGAWHAGTAHKLAPAIHWTHTMWRLFQHHPKYSLKTEDIMACSRTAHRAAMPAPRKENR